MRPIRPATEPSLQGHWTLHLYIGERLFEDDVRVARLSDGSFGGTLTVPGLWTAPIDKVRVEGKDVRFEIETDEGRGPFRVEYRGQFDDKGDTFVGFASSGGEPFGGFVAQRLLER